MSDNDYNFDGTPYVDPFPWAGCIVAALALVAYPLLIILMIVSPLYNSR